MNRGERNQNRSVTQTNNHVVKTSPRAQQAQSPTIDGLALLDNYTQKLKSITKQRNKDSRSVQKQGEVGQRRTTEGKIYDFKVSDTGIVQYLL